MKNLIYLILIVLTITSCDKRDVLEDTDLSAELILNRYLDWFIEDAAIDGVDLSYVYDSEIELSFVDSDDWSGKAFGMHKRKVSVQIDYVNWTRLSAVHKKKLMYHELGHDILNLTHKSGAKIMVQGWNYVDFEQFEADVPQLFETYKNK